MNQWIEKCLSRLERKALENLFGQCPKNFDIVLSNRQHLWLVTNPKYTIIFNHPLVLPKLVLFANDLVVGKAFIDKEIDIEGDIVAATELKDNFTCFEKGLLPYISLFFICLKIVFYYIFHLGLVGAERKLRTCLCIWKAGESGQSKAQY